jgi:hypothetical protein
MEILMSKPIQIVMGANQPKEIYEGLKGNTEALKRWEQLMRIFGLSESEIALIKGEQK